MLPALDRMEVHLPALPPPPPSTHRAQELDVDGIAARADVNEANREI